MFNKMRTRSGEIVDRQPKSPEKALEALRFICSKMERSEGDCRRSLTRWMVDKEKWETIIEKLKADKYVDHNRYARCYVREKMNFGGWGERKVIQGLRLKGVEKEIIESAIAELMNVDQAHERLVEMVGKKYKQLKSKPHKSEYEIKGKLLNWGAYRGYEFDAVNRALREVIENLESEGE